MYGSDYHYDNEAQSQHQAPAAATTVNSAAPSSQFSSTLSHHSPSAEVGVKQEEPNTSTPTAAPASALGASTSVIKTEGATRSNYSDSRPEQEQEQGGHIKNGSIGDLYKSQSPTIMQQQQNSPVSFNTGSTGAPPASWQAGAAGSAAGGAAGQPAGGAGAPQTPSQQTPQPQPQGQQPGQQQSQQQQQQQPPAPTSSAQQQVGGAQSQQPQAQSQQQQAPTTSQAQQPQQQLVHQQQPQHHTPVGQHPGVPHSSHAPHPYPFFYPTHPYASYPTEEGNYYDQSTNPNATGQPQQQQQQIQPASGQDWMQDNNQSAMYGHMPYPYPPMGSHQWSGQMRYGDMSANAAAAAAAAAASATNGPTPQLVRTTALSQAATSLGSNAVGVHGHGSGLQAQQHDAMISNPQFRASLELISGQLESLSSNWTAEEWHAKRRLVQFTRAQRGAVISAEFFPLEQSKYTANTPCISCIHWAERNECYVTSVDCIYLLEQLVNTKFSVEEKNRIRRNLEGYHPLTVSKGKAESGSFFRLIMSFSAPKPRNIEKDVKVFQWKILPHALKKIISKYSADYGHTAAATASLTAPPVPPPMSQPIYLPPTMGAQPQQPPPPQQQQLVQQQQQQQQPGQQRQGTPQQSPGGVPPSNNAFGAYR